MGVESPQSENIEYPEGLTDQDILLVNRQCEIQSATSKEQIEGFAKAYKEAKDLVSDENISVFEEMDGEAVEEMILRFAQYIESRNEKGYRKVPVKFRNGGSALKWESIPRAIEGFSGAYADGVLSSVEAYKEFETIHPFEDGNGRLGDLLWKMDVKRKTGSWPEELPPDIFGDRSEEE